MIKDTYCTIATSTSVAMQAIFNGVSTPVEPLNSDVYKQMEEIEASVITALRLSNDAKQETVFLLAPMSSDRSVLICSLCSWSDP
jgi:hypothetical protein